MLSRSGFRKNLKPGWIILAVCIFSIASIARLVPGPRIIDDSYITYRYARNILAGNGFVYNPGERVLGTTTPLYTLLLVLIGSITGGVQAPFPEISLIMNAFVDGLTCLLLIQLGRHLSKPFAGVGAAFVWAIAPYSVTFAVGGLETSLYVLLIVATVTEYVMQRYRLAWLLAALAFLTRPDALILIAPLGLDRLTVWLGWRYRRKIEVRTLLVEALIFLIPTISWLTFATLYFGNPLPHSIAAKSLAYRLPETAALVRLVQHYATPFLEHLTFGTGFIVAGFSINIFLFLLGSLSAIRNQARVWPWVSYPVLYFATFAIANPLIFRWYLTPPLPAYILTILMGAEGLLRQLFGINNIAQPRNHWKNPVFKALSSILIILVPTFLHIRGWTLHPDHGSSRPAPGMAFIQLELDYQRAVETLSKELSTFRSTPLIAAGDVGVIGYFSGARILDTVGLNSPVSTSYYPLDASYYSINFAIPPNLILDLKPDYIIILEIYGREGLLKQPGFWNMYDLVTTIPTDIYGSNGMLLFRKSRPPD